MTAANRLFYGDNLDIMRDHIPDASVDLVYLDPPFNSKRDYNVLFKEESAEALDRWREVANGPDLGVESDDTAVKRYDATDGGPMF